MSLGVVRSRYVQPFGTFSGALPGALAPGATPSAAPSSRRHAAR